MVSCRTVDHYAVRDCSPVAQLLLPFACCAPLARNDNQPLLLVSDVGEGKEPWLLCCRAAGLVL